MSDISVIGLGYIGLPTAALFAANGFRVNGVDINERICQLVSGGGVHIEEPGLRHLVQSTVSRGALTASTMVSPAKVFIIAVPTPLTSANTADLSFVEAAARSIAPVIRKGDLVILESTVSPGCTESVLAPILEKGSGLSATRDFFLCYCPERVLPGKIIHELVNNNRIIGGYTPDAAEAAKRLYGSFVRGSIYLTDLLTAELTKLIENTFRDVNVALANELAMVCEKIGVNVWEAIDLANRHPRVNVLQPGPGVGGHCLAVDPWFVVGVAEGVARITELARRTNDAMPSFLEKKISTVVPRGGRIVILGCTYKPDIDDLRESPILKLANLLISNYEVRLVDPYVSQYSIDPIDAADGADALVLGVQHSVFRNLDLLALRQVMRNNLLIDTRNYFDRQIVHDSGFIHILLGDGLCRERSALAEVAATTATRPC